MYVKLWFSTLLLFVPLLGFALSNDSPLLSERKSGAIFHDRYPPDRWPIQDKLALEAAQGGKVSESPRIIFTAGGYGAGKSTIIRKLSENGLLNENDFVRIDCDEIKSKIPEFQEYFKKNPVTASELVHSESMAIAQLALEKSLAEGKNIIFDSSLRYVPYYEQLIERIRKTRPEYSVEILHVDSDLEKVVKAVQERALSNQLYYTPESVLESAAAVKPAVEKLSPKVDRIIKFKNYYDGNPILESIRTADGITVVQQPLGSGGHAEESLKQVIHSKTPSKTYHVVFDLDNTVVNVPGNETPVGSANWQWVEAQGVKYRIPDHLGATMKNLSERPDVRISFFSGGTYERNLELLKTSSHRNWKANHSMISPIVPYH